ncbi:MAG: tyrosine-type recombinase/integrase [Desulfobulbus sp.]|jgi:integrase
MLTAIQARNAKPREKAYKLNDGKGLFLHIATSGKKTWRYRYELPPGRESTFVIGEYPVISLEEARVERAALRELVKAGIRPADARRQEKLEALAEEEAARLVAENSFEAIALEWITLQEPRWSASHTKSTRNTLQANVFPYLGDTPVDKITPPDVLEIVRRIEDRGCGEMAAKTLQRIRCVCRYAVQTGRAIHNPAGDMQGVLRAKKTTSHAALKKEELPAFFQALHDGDIHRVTKDAILFTILTAARSGETRLATWDEIDEANQLWTIPAKRMKMGSAHKVPLSRQAMAILAAMRPYAVSNTGYVFPGIHNPHSPLSGNTMLYGLYRIGYHSKATMHGFRATFSTILNEDTAFDKDAIERALAHKEVNRVRAAYHRSEYLEERREMMQWWADYLDKLREG